MKIAGMTLVGLLAGVLIGGCCYFICTLAHINLIWAYLLAAAIDVAGFIWLYKRYEQKADAAELLPQADNKAEKVTPETTVSNEESQPSETPEEVLV
ncbi:hypothetical protein [Spirosoma harenae]